MSVAARAEAAAPRRHKSVAVIGAGAAGLVAARELRKENMEVTVFERGSEVGGTWVYNDGSKRGGESCSSSGNGDGDGGGHHIHSSLYDNLRVNLPREIMGYSDYSFGKEASAEAGFSRDGRRYCHHSEVLYYLRSFAQKFGLEDLVQRDTLVEKAEPLLGGGVGDGGGAGWRLTLNRKGRSEREEGVFDALVVCNGHFEVPRKPRNLAGAAFLGAQMHSRDYKRSDAEVFRGKNVLVVGTGPSGDDLSREVSAVAENVYWSGRLFKRIDAAKLGRIQESVAENVHLRPNIAKVAEDGRTVHFECQGGGDNSSAFAPVAVDTILWCTGYEYAVPFLDGREVGVSTAQGRIEPLYEHLFHPKFGASLSFIGLGFKILPFPHFEIQAAWVARCLAGKCTLPTEQEMAERARAFYDGFGEAAGPGAPAVEYTHCMDGIQWSYLQSISDQPGMEGAAHLPPWKREMYDVNRKKKGLHPTEYRDLVLEEELPLIQVGLEEVARSNNPPVPSSNLM